ncbi:hypothetical protein [Pseudothermotoga sp.]|nr:hypothetical protein [Pseudothermotoga sp.]
MKINRWILLALIVVLVILLGPFLVIFLASFEPTSSLRFPPTGFTLSWFKKVINMPMFQKSFLLSLRLALLSSAVSLLLGVPVAYVTARYDFRAKRFLEFITTLPVIIPGLVAGLALLRFFVLLNVFSIETTLLIGHTAIVLPYVVRSTL